MSLYGIVKLKPRFVKCLGYEIASGSDYDVALLQKYDFNDGDKVSIKQICVGSYSTEIFIAFPDGDVAFNSVMFDVYDENDAAVDYINVTDRDDIIHMYNIMYNRK